jgi:putative aminopeptidase FrvX
MDKAESLKLISDLSDANGASGFEYDVVSVLRKAVSGLGTVDEDSLHDLYVNFKGNSGNRPRMLLDAHTDEVSFMVKDIKPDGTLDFIVLGGIVSWDIPAHKVRVRTKDGTYIPGIISSTPPHFLSEAERKLPPDETSMSIDIGATSKEDAERNYGIRIGEPAVPDVAFWYDKSHDRMFGKAFDCRLGCACIVRTLDALKEEKNLGVDLIAGFSVQEEVGTRGATVTATKVKPDIAIVFEGCPADDTVVQPYASQTRITEGPMLRYIDKRMITNPRYQRFALDLAEERNIPVQAGVRTGGSTNGAPIHLSNNGVPTIVIGIPVRYIHTHYGIACFADVEASTDLAVALIKKLDADSIHSF